MTWSGTSGETTCSKELQVGLKSFYILTEMSFSFSLFVFVFDRLVFSSSAELWWHLTVELVPPDVYGTSLLIFSDYTGWKCELIWILLWWFSVKSDEICSVLGWKPGSCQSAFVSHLLPCFLLLSYSSFFYLRVSPFSFSVSFLLFFSSSLCVLSLTYKLFISVALTDFWSHLSLLLSLPHFLLLLLLLFLFLRLTSLLHHSISSFALLSECLIKRIKLWKWGKLNERRTK